MSSGPGALTGPRATELRAMLDALGVRDGSVPDRAALRGRRSPSSGTRTWSRRLSRPDVPAQIVAFLARRMQRNDPYGLVAMARQSARRPGPDGRAGPAGPDPDAGHLRRERQCLVPGRAGADGQAAGARRVCIPGAVHSPAVEAPATTAGALTQFWDAAEAATSARTAATPMA